MVSRLSHLTDNCHRAGVAGRWLQGQGSRSLPNSTFIGQPLFPRVLAIARRSVPSRRRPWDGRHMTITPGRSEFSIPMTEPEPIVAMAVVGGADPAIVDLEERLRAA